MRVELFESDKFQKPQKKNVIVKTCKYLIYYLLTRSMNAKDNRAGIRLLNTYCHNDFIMMIAAFSPFISAVIEVNNPCMQGIWKLHSIFHVIHPLVCAYNV